LIDEDVELLKSFPIGLPHLYFFRHKKEIPNVVRVGQRFNERRFYYWWKKACSNLGVTNVDLYGGTRHSSVSALRDNYSPEEIRRASMHTTNKAFDRYFQVPPDELRSVYEATRGGKELAKKNQGFKKINP
jgi:hypothetical protein